MQVTSIVDEVVDVAVGYTRGQDAVSSLKSPIVPADTTFEVTNAQVLSVGPVEIGDELVQVASVDSATGIATVEGWGRGVGGTTAASHTTGEKVTVNPVYPRSRARNAIFGVLREIFPDIFAVAETTLDGSPSVTNFTMPANCWDVLRVETKVLGPSGMWAPVPRWRQNKRTSTVELEVIGPVVIGTGRVRVQYVRTPPATLPDVVDLSSYGYDNQLRDLIVLGATARLMSFTETSRVQVGSMEATGRAEGVAAGGAAQLSRQLDQRFRLRVETERARLLTRYPMQPHFTR